MNSDKNLKYVKANSRAWDQVSALRRQVSFKSNRQSSGRKMVFVTSMKRIP